MFSAKCSILIVCLSALSMLIHASDGDIFVVAEQGDSEAVKKLVVENPDLVTTADDGGYTPLHKAAYSGHLDVAAYLLSRGADVDASSGSGSAAIHGAAYYGHIEMVRLLLDNGAAYDMANSGGYTPLLGASAGNHGEIVRLLANKGADINASPQGGRAPLYQAVWNADAELTKFLLDRGAEPNIPTNGDISLPFFATAFRDREIGSLFASLASNLAETDELGLSMLHYSAARGFEEQIQEFLDRGADANAQDSLGRTPLFYASLWGHDEVVDVLETHGATAGDSDEVWLEGDYFGRPTPAIKPVEFVGNELRTPFAPHGGIAWSPDGNEMFWCHQAMPVQAMWYTRQVDGVWQKPIIAPFTDPTLDYADGSPCFSADGSRVYYHTHRPKIEADGRREDLDIWYVEKIATGWGAPEPLGSPINTAREEYGPMIAPSGNLYFVGEGYENGYGAGDIYVSEFVNGVYADPVNLGPQINSEYYELYPYVSPDESYILFSTNNVGSYPWGWPLQVSFRRKDGSWSKAAALGNTRNRGHIRNPSITADNRFVFYQQDAAYHWFSTDLIEETRLAVIGPGQIVAPTSIPKWHQSEQVFEPSRTNDIGLGDLDSDGDLDAVFSNMGDNDSRIYLNDGHGYFTATEQLLTRGGHGVDLGDIDADGDLDIFIARNGYTKDLMVYLNDGNANFTVSPQNLGDSLLAATSVHLYDFDTDGDLDAAVTYYQQDNAIYLNDGQGKFSRSDLTFSNGTSWADLDGDGDTDILLREADVGFKTLLNDGTGHFVEHWSKADSSVNRGWIGFGDMDQDGDLDAVVPYKDQSEHRFSTLWHNDGTGGFVESKVQLPLTRLSRMSTGDLNGDGLTDVFLNNAGLPSAVWLNDGNGGLYDSGIRLPGEWQSLHTFCPLGDLDGDGDLDAFIASFVDGPNELWFNDQ